jgi:branched-chain amino acid transport system substrate-binding protein
VIRSRKTRLVTLVSMGALVVLGVGACGSSKSSSAGQPSSTTAASQSSSSTVAATGTPFKIGVLATLSGASSSSVAISAPVMKAWAAYVNSHGGIDGHDVQLVVASDQATPSVGLSQAQNMVHDGVIAFVGGLAGESAFAWASYVNGAKVPVIAGPATASGFTPADTYFYPSGTDYISDTSTMWQVVSKQFQSGRIAIGYCAEVPACATVPATTNKAIETEHLNNLKIVYSTALASSAPSYTPECLAAKSANANVLYLGISSTTTDQLISQCKEQGFTPTPVNNAEAVSGEYLTNSAFNGAVGSLTEFPWWDTSHPGVNTFIAAMQQSHVNWESEPASAAEAWAAGEIFATAVETGHLGDNATGAQLAAALNAFNNQTVGGLLPPLTFTNGNRTVPCGWGWESLNGNWMYPTGVGNQLLCATQ